MPFIHDIGIRDETDGWEQNWYPKTKTFIVRDNHCDCSVSLDFSKTNVHTLPPADQSFLFCLTIPLNMRCKAELLYYEGDPWKVRLTQLPAEEVEAEREELLGRRKGRNQTGSPVQSAQRDNSTHQESAH